MIFKFYSGLIIIPDIPGC